MDTERIQQLMEGNDPADVLEQTSDNFQDLDDVRDWVLEDLNSALGSALNGNPIDDEFASNRWSFQYSAIMSRFTAHFKILKPNRLEVTIMNEVDDVRVIEGSGLSLIREFLEATHELSEPIIENRIDNAI